MVELLLTADEAKALSACLNLAVKTLGICSETTHALAMHGKLEMAIAAANDVDEDASVDPNPNSHERPN